MCNYCETRPCAVYQTNMTTTNPQDYQLTREQVKQFHQQGFLGPFALFPPETMDAYRDQIVNQVLTTDGPAGQPQSRHLDHRCVYELCTHPAIMERMAGLYGPDLILWRSHFFSKEPGGAEIPWHQDAHYWPLEPAINISAWLALDPATVDNSCVQIIPGSHKTIVPTTKTPNGMNDSFGEMADPKFFDAAQAVNMELQPGEFFLFNESTLHHSEPNRSRQRRMGLAVRVTVPFVVVDHSRLFPDHRVMVARGQDYMGFNRVAPPPA